MRSLLCLVPAVLAAGAGRVLAEDATDGRTRAEELEALIQSAVSESSSSPTVLGDFDVKHADASSRKAARALKTTKVDVEFTQQPIESVLALFAKVAGVPFVLSAKAQMAVKSSKADVTFAISGLALENVINLLMEQLHDFRFTVRYGAVVCMLKEEYKPKTVLVLYDVSDVIRPRPDFPAPKLGLSGKDDTPK